MKENNVLSSLCYFSIFFAPFLFPIVVYFLANGEVKYHAKKALWTHLVPYVALIIGLVVTGVAGINEGTGTVASYSAVATFCIFAVIGIYFFIWNIVKGIKVLKEN
ncbi:DUF4870 domain-containing protein [Paenibacillus larvae]|uniref:DUF4870 domain-containing protein n=3 Tax=Paenibacillus larvae TaxID=1464 RepID=A0A2L1TNQ9_9BACL|nr:DUF4870 domain-containing protein [Paenibacillus larvae]AQR76809.1 DUF4870 domain-containing protein [Paenibacillus larvae subsp. larvae]AQZ48552.1 DUF4870 domain-containing protein [Paenibacillus larvae subsp. pulvifaciens]ARF70279.1 DUF4870 domain-containing protein [Paenibacillus larvae subsp. pulvifaciens]AVF22301.1 hypothetical protein ERICI_02463 [Paenibacillus larvae subsp. larvae]AVF26623.1 hypothetical protein ERICIII_02471 [Paenibacillus larvae subsp. larvae]